MQAKIFFAVVSATPAQVIAQRADANEPNMGLHSWAGDRILSSDVTVGKNYLAVSEATELNRLTGILLDIFEDQLDIGRLTKMSEANTLLDRQLKELGRAVLNRPGPPSSDEAKEIAKAKYKIFDLQRRAMNERRTRAEITDLLKTQRALPKPSQRKRKK